GPLAGAGPAPLAVRRPRRSGRRGRARVRRSACRRYLPPWRPAGHTIRRKIDPPVRSQRTELRLHRRVIDQDETPALRIPAARPPDPPADAQDPGVDTRGGWDGGGPAASPWSCTAPRRRPSG